MPAEKILNVDFAQEDACLEILPRSPLASSYHANWNGIRLDHHRQPAHETPEHRPQQHTISISVEHNIIKAERVLNGCLQNETILKGDIAVIPAYTPRVYREQVKI